MKRLFKRSALAFLVASAIYLVLLANPRPLFAYELRHAGIVVHAVDPIPPEMAATLEHARLRLRRSPLAAATEDVHVFICGPRPLFAFFARQNYNAGGVSDWLVGQHVFLRDSDMRANRLIGPSGTPVASDRPLSYFIAHELMHIANVATVGRRRYARMPQWVDDGYADYIARDIDLAAALQKLKEGARELDPARSGLYLRFHLMVAYLLEKKHLPLDDLLRRPPAKEDVERELLQRPAW